MSLYHHTSFCEEMCYPAYVDDDVVKRKGRERMRRLASIAREVFAERPFIVVTNREPYEHVRGEDGTVTVRKPVGGLTAALDPLMQAIGGTWIAWGSGSGDRAASDNDGCLTMPPGKDAYRMRRVFLSPEEITGFYEGHVNQTIWPLFHAQTERVRFRRQEWDMYQRVNRIFADAVTAELSQRVENNEAIIWFQDYHFATAPAMLRDMHPQARILQFWHIPWPPWELFRQHPQRRAILEGLLGCDLIGMHIDLFCHNFLECVQRELHLPVSFSTQQIILGERVVRVRALPISIDADRLQTHAQSQRAVAVGAEFVALHRLGECRMGIGVERNDYTKGILERLYALELLFEQYPEWIEHFTFVQISPPSRERLPAYQSFQKTVLREVQRINFRFQTNSWKPVIFIRRRQSQAQLAALYRRADLAIVSSLQDGMNLVAKEYIAANMEEKGVLVLSEFAGASEEIPQALRINPYDVEGFAHAIHTALIMPEDERIRRMRRMRQHLFSNTIYEWMEDLFGELRKIDGSGQGSAAPSPLFDSLDELREQINSAEHIMLFLDYDGVLAPIASRPEEAALGPDVRDLVVKLRDSANVRVCVISGRSLTDVMDLVRVEHLTYAGNHGLEITNPAFQRVHPGAEQLRVQLESLYRVLREALRPFSGVIVENKVLSLTVHYRLADPGAVPDMLELCHSLVKKWNVGRILRVTTGKRVLEVRPNLPWDKGRAAVWILKELYGDDWQDIVLPIYLGDDETDEDAFRALQKSGITIRVGSLLGGETLATYGMDHTEDVPSFLDWLERSTAKNVIPPAQE